MWLGRLLGLAISLANAAGWRISHRQIALITLRPSLVELALLKFAGQLRDSPVKIFEKLGDFYMSSFLLSSILRFAAVFDDLEDLINLFVLVLDCAWVSYFNTVSWLVCLLASSQFRSQSFQQFVCFTLCGLILDDWDGIWGTTRDCLSRTLFRTLRRILALLLRFRLSIAIGLSEVERGLDCKVWSIHFFKGCSLLELTQWSGWGHGSEE